MPFPTTFTPCATCSAMVLFLRMQRRATSHACLHEGSFACETKLGIDVSLPDLAQHHLDINLGGHLNKQTEAGLLTILALEEERYAEMLRKGTNVIQTQLKSVPKNSDVIPDELLFTMNDSHGLAPDMAITLARNAGWSHVTLRTGFSAEMAERHARLAKEAASADATTVSSLDVACFPATIPLYYDAVYQPSTDVSATPADGQGPEVQPMPWCLMLRYPRVEARSDHGTLAPAATSNVLDTQKIGDVIVHFTDQIVDVDAPVQGFLDWKRKHHGPSHGASLANASPVGNSHLRAGSHLSVESGRLDIHTTGSAGRFGRHGRHGDAVLADVRHTEKTEQSKRCRLDSRV